MDLELKDRTVMITGGSRGIGAGTARVMAGEGANLILVARDQEKLDQTRATILEHSAVRIDTVVCDLTQGDSISALAARHPDIDILVNNAGAVPGGDLFDVDEARWRAGWDTKVFNYINMCRAYYPLMAKRGGGVIVNVLGIGSRTKRWDYLCGGMGNAALDFFTETLGAHSPVDNIRVIGVVPGAVGTERWHSITTTRFRNLEGLRPTLPFNRVAAPEEIGAAIAFLASSRSSYTSGSLVTIDGGSSIGQQQPSGHTTTHPN